MPRCWVPHNPIYLSRWDEDDEDLSGLIAAAHDERGLQLEQLVWELPTAAARMGGEREISIIQLRRPV